MKPAASSSPSAPSPSPGPKRSTPSRSGAIAHTLFLGPQSETPTLEEVLHDLVERGRLSADARLAAITAGWRDREAEPGIVDPRVVGRVTELELFRRAETVARQDPDLAAGHEAVQHRLKALRRAYNLRLGGLIDAWVRLGELRGEPEILDGERTDALEAIRELDARHLDRVRELGATFEDTFRPLERETVQTQRDEIRGRLGGVEAIIIAGGHIASLLNRLRLFGVAELIEGRILIGWSAGAMALSRRVVLFHDRPPWGAGNAEVFDQGLGLVEGIVPFPHAEARLALDDRLRTGRLAKRLAPDACVLLDAGMRIEWVDGSCTGSEDVERLDRAGRRRRFGQAAA